jgi:hypothetical protein
MGDDLDDMKYAESVAEWDDFFGRTYYQYKYKYTGNGNETVAVPVKIKVAATKPSEIVDEEDERIIALD